MSWLGRPWCASACAHAVWDWRAGMPQESTPCSWHTAPSEHVQGGDKSSRAAGIRDCCQTLRNAWNLIRKKQRESQYYVSSISLTWVILIKRLLQYLMQFIPCFVVVHNLEQHWVRLILKPQIVHPMILMKPDCLFIRRSCPVWFSCRYDKVKGMLNRYPCINFNSFKRILKNCFQNWNKQETLNRPKH